MVLKQIKRPYGQPPKLCLDCEKQIQRTSKRCKTHASIAREHERPWRRMVTNQVLAIRQVDSQRKATDIAKAIGVSRERVRQILNKHGLPTAIAPLPKRCKDCSTIISEYALRCMPCSWESGRIHTVCPYCKSQITVTKAEYQRTRQSFCNHSHAALWSWLPGNPSTMRKGKILKRLRLDTEPKGC